MRLVSLSIERYRSIIKAPTIPFEDYTVLVGPNNEGKSNILRGLSLAMLALESFRRPTLNDVYVRARLRHLYDWQRDFPIHLQGKKKTSQTSVLTIEVELTQDEVAEFQSAIKSRLNGLLRIAVTLGPQGFLSLAVKKKGPGAKTLTKKSPAIARFVASRLRFEHIPAVRTADEAQKIVEHLLGRELRQLESDPEYTAAVRKIAELQAPLLEEVGKRIRETLGPFLPNLSAVELTIAADERYEALSSACEVFLDDGAKTLLRHKGDGVQSLAALALMRDASSGRATGKRLVVAVEEPESHLHPGAVHELRNLLAEMSVDTQVIVTTHNPLFVDRLRTSNNIIVKDKKATVAGSLEDLRQLLGVQAGDNLKHAALVLVVEGECDREIVSALLSTASTTLKAALRDGLFSIEPLQGGGKLAYKLSTLRASLYPAHVLLDADQSGIEASAAAIRDGLVRTADVSHTTFPGKHEAEIEDWIDPRLYAAAVLSESGIDVTRRQFAGRGKWSRRMQSTAIHQGKLWTPDLERDMKVVVARQVRESPDTALLPPAAEILDSLVKTLESRLTSI